MDGLRDRLRHIGYCQVRLLQGWKVMENGRDISSQMWTGLCRQARRLVRAEIERRMQRR